MKWLIVLGVFAALAVYGDAIECYTCYLSREKCSGLLCDGKDKYNGDEGCEDGVGTKTCSDSCARQYTLLKYEFLGHKYELEYWGSDCGDGNFEGYVGVNDCLTEAEEDELLGSADAYDSTLYSNVKYDVGYCHCNTDLCNGAINLASGVFFTIALAAMSHFF